MKTYLKDLIQNINRRVEEYGAQYTVFGIFGLINFPVYYFVWIYFSKQPYSNLLLRIIATLLCLVLALNKYWPKGMKNFLPIYWYCTLSYCLPFFFTYMLVKNGFASMWVANSIAALFFLILFVDFKAFIALMLIGIVLGLFFANITTSPIIKSEVPIDYFGMIITFMVSFIIGGLFARNRENIIHVKFQTMKLLGASIAHELRTPLGSIQSGTKGIKNYLPELIDGYQIAKKNHLIENSISRDHLEILYNVLDNIIAETNHANNIVDILLVNIKYTDIQSTKFRVYSISECIEYALSHYSFSSTQKDKVEFKGSGGVDFIFHGDKLLIVHVLYNLLKNALYFVEKVGKGKIYIWLETGEKYNQLHFKDTGKGIAKKDLPYIFDRFFTKETHRGSGIGLSFCKMVMEAHHGEIICHAVEGEYTEFVLLFPIIASKGE